MNISSVSNSSSLPSRSWLCNIIRHYFCSMDTHLLSTQNLQNQIDQEFADQPWKLGLRNGHNICRTTTKAIVNILSYQSEIEKYSTLYTGCTPSLAIYGIAIHIVRNPAAEAVKADLELQLPPFEFQSLNINYIYFTAWWTLKRIK